jgi:hypothetical protein
MLKLPPKICIIYCVSLGVPSPGAHTTTIDRNKGNQVGRTLSAFEEKQSSYMGRVGVPWACDAPRGETTQDAL